MSNVFLVLYIPTLHRGYQNLFERHANSVDGLFILGQGLINQLIYLEREIRALDPVFVKLLLERSGMFRRVGLLEDVADLVVQVFLLVDVDGQGHGAGFLADQLLCPPAGVVVVEVGDGGEAAGGAED